MYFADVTSSNSFLGDISQVSFGMAPFQSGGANGSVFYNEFVKGTGSFQFTSKTQGSFSCGPASAPVGNYNTTRCKSGPIISSVGPLSPNAAGRVVVSGGAITVNGV
jgi:hypothetical protein